MFFLLDSVCPYSCASPCAAQGLPIEPGGCSNPAVEIPVKQEEMYFDLSSTTVSLFLGKSRKIHKVLPRPMVGVWVVCLLGFLRKYSSTNGVGIKSYGPG